MSIQTSTTPPSLAAVRVIQLLPGRGDEFTRVMTSDFVPALKKAGVKDYVVYATNFGAPQGQFVMVDPIAKYADLDRGNPLVRSGIFTAETAAPINAKINALISSSEVDLYRYVPALSYGMPRRPTSQSARLGSRSDGPPAGRAGTAAA